MSGHNKWSSIKHQKGVTDAKRGQLFTKLTREIIVAVRQGGSDPETNFRLRLAVQKARDSNMPIDNIDRAISRGSGKTEDGSSLAELTLEGYGSSGAAIMVNAVTDNRNRTLQEVRNIFTRNGGSLGEAGSVGWLFDPKGLIRLEAKDSNVDDLTLQAIDAGAEDVKVDSTNMEIYTKPQELESTRKALEQQKIPIESTELTMLPKTMVELDEKAALQTLRLLDKLEELDEVQAVYSNIDFNESVLEKYQSGA